MTPRSELKVQGNFLLHPFAELVAEIAQWRLNGSLRLTDKEKKCVVYFRSGSIVFAASNARTSRLFDMLLQRGKIRKEQLAKAPNFSNDFEFAAFLQEKGLAKKEDCDILFAQQIEAIVVDLLSWTSGDWSFSSLVRIKDGLSYQIDATQLLVDYGRTLAAEKVLSRFRSLDDVFSGSEDVHAAVELKPEESLVLSRSYGAPLTINEIMRFAGVAQSTAAQLVYTLWLGGFLTRDGWQPAFPRQAVASMKNAKLELTREARSTGVSVSRHDEKAVKDEPKRPPTAAPSRPAVPEIDIETYLKRVEGAVTHYDILGVDSKANAETIKTAYFSLARMFHPDRYHAEGGETLLRVQNAFTMLAQAHETLKSTESRDVYDYRMRKELADRDKYGEQSTFGNASLQAEQASENFELGFKLLMEEEYEEASPLLARAVHYAPKQARYRAYYGKALSFDETKRHQAESEMQAALKLDPNNPTFRIMLAEFYIKENLLKRAEGELTRLLATFPSNREARELLDSLKVKA